LTTPLPSPATTWSTYFLFLTRQRRQNALFLRADRTPGPRDVYSSNRAISWGPLPRPLAIHDSLTDVLTVVAKPDTAPTIPNRDDPESPDEPLVGRLDDRQSEAFFSLWDTVSPHNRPMDFAFDATGRDSATIDALSSTLTDFADVFSSSKLDYRECSLRPFQIKAPPGAQAINSRP